VRSDGRGSGCKGDEAYHKVECLKCLKFEVPKVKELRDFFKRTGFIKASKINQARKHTQQKVKDFDRFVRLDLRKSRLQAGLDKHLVLEPFILKCQTSPLTLGTLGTSNFRHFFLSSQFLFIGHLIRFIDNLPS